MNIFSVADIIKGVDAAEVRMRIIIEENLSNDYESKEQSLPKYLHCYEGHISINITFITPQNRTIKFKTIVPTESKRRGEPKTNLLVQKRGGKKKMSSIFCISFKYKYI